MRCWRPLSPGAAVSAIRLESADLLLFPIGRERDKATCSRREHFVGTENLDRAYAWRLLDIGFGVTFPTLDAEASHVSLSVCSGTNRVI